MATYNSEDTITTGEYISEEQLDQVVGGSAKSFFKKLGHDLKEGAEFAAPYIGPAIMDGADIIGEAIE